MTETHAIGIGMAGEAYSRRPDSAGRLYPPVTVTPGACLTAADLTAFHSEHVAPFRVSRAILDAEHPCPAVPPTSTIAALYAPGALADGRNTRSELARLADISSNQSNNREHQKRETRNGP